MWRIVLCWCSAAIVAAATPVPASEEQRDETYPVLNVGDVAYSNVVVKTKTRTDLFISHTSGFANIKVRDLDRSTQLQLGYQVEPETATNEAALTFSAEKIVEDLESRIPPELEEKYEQAVWEAKELITQLPPWFPYALLSGCALLYLLFCNCCRQICRKAGKPASPLIWLPVFKQIPLLRASGLCGWWFLLNLLPPLLMILYMVWSFKIARARDKGPVIGLLLLLPVLQVFAFLYLAWSSGQGDPTPEEREARKVISLFHDKRAA